MGLVAGMTLPDGVVMVADGMIATFTEGETEPTGLNPDGNKFEQVSDCIYAVRDGIDVISGAIIERLRGVSYRSPGQVRDRLHEAAGEVWAEAEPLAAKLGDVGEVGVLVGGHVDGEPFLSGVLRHPTEDPKDVHWGGPWAVWVWGLEPETDKQFYNTVGKATNGSFNRFGWPPYQGPMNDVITNVAGNMVAVMQDVAEDNPLSGGAFRFAVVRAGYEPLEERITVTPSAQPGGGGQVNLGTPNKDREDVVPPMFMRKLCEEIE